MIKRTLGAPTVPLSPALIDLKLNYDLGREHNDSALAACFAVGVLCARASGVASRVAVERYSGPEGEELGYWWVFRVFYGWMEGWMDVVEIGISCGLLVFLFRRRSDTRNPSLSSHSSCLLPLHLLHVTTGLPPPPKISTGNLLQLFNAKGLRFHHDLTRLYGDVVKIWGFFGVSRPCSPLQLNFS